MRTRSLRRLLFVTLLASGVALAVPATAMADTSAKHPTATAEKKKKKKPTVKVVDSDLGEILADAKGNTLYSFDADTNIDASACTGGCAGTWPPLEAKKAKAGKGLDATLLVIGEGGQVSYNGHLLYLFSGDSAPGDTTGHGVAGVWHAVDADGNPIA